MSISHPPIQAPLTGNDTPKTALASATNAVVLPPNLARAPGSFCINNSNKIMYLTFDGTPATTTGISIAVPANGGNIDIPGFR